MAANRQLEGKRAELFVFGELLTRHAVPYVPVVDIEGVDAIVKTRDGSMLAIQVKSAGVAGGKYPRWFQVEKAIPKHDLFYVLVEAPPGEIGNTWILPAKVFDKYASTPPKGGPRDLNLDTGKRKFGQCLAEVLCGFKNRWELLVEFERYRSLVDRVEDLEDVLAMQEALESPKDKMISLKEFER